MRKEVKKNLINKLMTSRMERTGKKTKFQESLCCGVDVSNLTRFVQKYPYYISGREMTADYRIKL